MKKRKLTCAQGIDIARRYNLQTRGHASVAVAATGLLPNLSRYFVADARAASGAVLHPHRAGAECAGQCADTHLSDAG